MFFSFSVSVLVSSQRFTKRSWQAGQDGQDYMTYAGYFFELTMWTHFRYLGWILDLSSQRGALSKSASLYFNAMLKWSPALAFHCWCNQSGTCNLPPFFNSHRRRNFALSAAFSFWSSDGQCKVCRNLWRVGLKHFWTPMVFAWFSRFLTLSLHSKMSYGWWMILQL